MAMATVKGTVASWSDVVNACADCKAIAAALDWDCNSKCDWHCDVLRSADTYVCTPLVSGKYLPQWYLHVYLRWAHTVSSPHHTHAQLRKALSGVRLRGYLFLALLLSGFGSSWPGPVRSGPHSFGPLHSIACCGESSAAKVRACVKHTHTAAHTEGITWATNSLGNPASNLAGKDV